MDSNVTVTGLVATYPRSITTIEGVAIMTFRLASPQRKRDPKTGVWTEGETNWYTVSAFQQLAQNATESFDKGDRVVVSGTLHLREWGDDTKPRFAAEIEATTIGLDLNHYVVHRKERVHAEPVAPSLDEN